MKHVEELKELYFTIHLAPRSHNNVLLFYHISIHLSVFLSTLNQVFKFILNFIFFIFRTLFSSLEALTPKMFNFALYFHI